jgi:hypothetical protein
MLLPGAIYSLTWQVAGKDRRDSQQAAQTADSDHPAEIQRLASRRGNGALMQA